MHYWNTKPFLRLFISFAVGIILYRYVGLFPVLCALTGALLISGIKPFTGIYHQYRWRYVYGLLIHIVFISFGYINMYIHDIRVASNWFAKVRNNEEMIIRISSPAKKRDSTYRCTGEVLYIYNTKKWKRTRGNVLLQIPPGVDSPLYHTVFYVSAKTTLIPPPRAGSSFDYRAFMAKKNIYHSCSPVLTEILSVNRGYYPESVYGLTDNLQKEILAILDRYIPSPAENGLAKALLIGYRENLDKEIVKAYTNTGVIHVIAISGLHLGLIYAILSTLLQFMDKKLKVLKAIIIIAFLWIFSILCGASPSVLRSALMFTCLLSGEVLQKENYTVNTLASSAFMLLCIDPVLLWDIGFQLSYSAVASLLVYNRYFNSLYSFDNVIINFGWNSVVTSVSAQILTTPLVLFHFHQFPLLFILANLIAVPLSGIILILLIMLCCLHFWPSVAIFLGVISGWLSTVMNTQVSRLDRISFAVLRDI